MMRKSGLVWMVFLCGVAVAVGFAWYTRNVWEDYFITYRVSRNLAQGHGLVFQLGERVHTFTSPVGVLLPAALLWITGGTSDARALLAFQGLSILAFAAAVALLFRACRDCRELPGASALLIASGLLLDAKSVVFSVNGMETALLLLLLVLFILALGRRDPKAHVHLGLAAAGLQWVRPDAFILGLAVVAGAWLFHPAGLPSGKRSGSLKVLAMALVVAVVVYLPWLIWTWSYYGTPVPNTVLAKSQSLVLWNFDRISEWLSAPWIRGLQLAPLPIYPHMGGWPASLVTGWMVAVTILAHWWVLPWAEARGRAFSFSAFLFGLYLTQINVYPWYLPPASWLLLITAGFALADLGRWLRPAGFFRVALPVALAGLLLAGQAVLWVATARQLRHQQRLIEGQRAEIGRQLRAHASPGDRVFLECVGYIGFNSGLKILDYPGLTAPEVIRVRRRVADDWGAIVSHFKPEWLVLRPHELPRVNSSHYPSFAQDYFVAGHFTREKEINELQPMWGTPFLRFDQTFYVFRRR